MGKNGVVELLLDHGVNVNSISGSFNSYYRQFPLFIAAQLKNPTVLRTLLKRGANIDLKMPLQWQTALHNACYHLNVENIKILVSVGANMFDKNKYGRTPFELFLESNNLKHPGIRLMLKTLAVRRACLEALTIETEEELSIKGYHPVFWLYYQECQENIRKIKFTKFIESRTFFEFLTKCHCRIAPLMSNPEFETEFQRQDLDFFSMYAEDIHGTFERARHCYESTLEQEEVINEAVYYVLPELVVRKVVRYILICEECEIKQIVQASRSIQQ